MSAPFTVARNHGIPFFNGLLDQNLLISEALSWIGTPFHPHGRIKFAGVDCVNLVAEIYMQCGVIEEFKPPRYTMDGGHHLDESMIEAYAASTGVLRRLQDDSSLMVGDLLCFKVDRVTHHAGVLLRWPKFIHVLQGYRVQDDGNLHDPTWSKRLTSVWRPMRK